MYCCLAAAIVWCCLVLGSFVVFLSFLLVVSCLGPLGCFPCALLFSILLCACCVGSFPLFVCLSLGVSLLLCVFLSSLVSERLAGVL